MLRAMRKYTTRNYDRNTFYCFSPPVMIATFVIEIALAVWAIVRYKPSTATWLATALLSFLALFQLAEYLVCQKLGGDALLWSRIGFMSTTMLPPLGIHLVHVLAGAKKRLLVWPAYALAALFIAFFALVGRSLDGHACMGNYVIFQVAPGFGGLYGVYYYGLLIGTLLLGLSFIRRSRQRKTKKALGALMFGYAIFLIPTTTASLLKPETISAIPSIMCGFAVLLALVLSFIVLPIGAQKKMPKK